MKKFLPIFRIAITALRSNILRAALTTLGIIIGIAAVIVMMEIGQGSQAAIEKTISTMGSNAIMVMPGTAASGGVSFGSGSIMTLTAEDSDAIRKEVTAVKASAPIVRARTQIVYGNKNWVPQNIFGTTPEYLAARNWTVPELGTIFDMQAVTSGARVCLIGETIMKELFDNKSPIGKEIRIQNVAFTVIGVLPKKGSNMMGQDQDDIVVAPWTAIKYRVSGSTTATTATTTTTSSTDSTATATGAIYPSTGVVFYPPVTSGSSDMVTKRLANVDQIQIAAASAEQIKPAIERITEILRLRHKIRDGDPEDFIIRDMTELANAFSSTSAMMTKLLLTVAFIALVVGGVGIMNIMLVSVTERTREIGLRMAVGAHGRDIMMQFLTEAIVLCLIGGILGITFGRLVSMLTSMLLGWSIQISIPAIAASLVVSVSVGVIFGYYPAKKASQLNPIEALRYE